MVYPAQLFVVPTLKVFYLLSTKAKLRKPEQDNFAKVHLGLFCCFSFKYSFLFVCFCSLHFQICELEVPA